MQSKFATQQLVAPRSWPLFVFFGSSALACSGLFLGPFGWLGTLFFGCCALFGVYRSIFPDRLTLSTGGIDLNGATTPWENIEAFGVSYDVHSLFMPGAWLSLLLLHPTRVVGYRLKQTNPVLDGLGLLDAGYHVTLPSNFRQDPEDFAKELNRWRVGVGAPDHEPQNH